MKDKMCKIDTELLRYIQYYIAQFCMVKKSRKLKLGRCHILTNFWSETFREYVKVVIYNIHFINLATFILREMFKDICEGFNNIHQPSNE